MKIFIEVKQTKLVFDNMLKIHATHIYKEVKRNKSLFDNLLDIDFIEIHLNIHSFEFPNRFYWMNNSR